MATNPAFLVQRMNMFRAAQSFQAWFQYAASAVLQPNKVTSPATEFTVANVALLERIHDNGMYGPRGTVLPFADAYYQSIRDDFVDAAQKVLDAQPSKFGLDQLQDFVNIIRGTAHLDADLLNQMDEFAPHPDYVKAVAKSRERTARRNAGF